MATNRYPGVCENCRARVPAFSGAYLTIDGKPTVLCREHAPRQGQLAVRLELVGSQIHIRPTVHLGDRFDAFRAAVDGTAKFDRMTKVNVAALSDLGVVVRRLTEAGFAVERSSEVEEAAREIDDRAAAEVAGAAARATEVDLLLRSDGKRLMAFQGEGIAWLAPRAGAILADEMGLGKTIQALVAAPRGVPVLVVCPKVAKGVWQREAARWRPDLAVAVLSGRGSFRWPVAGEMVVINYDILPELLSLEEVTKIRAEVAGAADAKLAKLQVKIASHEVAEKLLASVPAGLVAIADEAHVLKGSVRKVDRARIFREIAERARATGGRAWLVTGSPLLNKPSELWNLLRVVGMTGEVFGTYDRFLELCGGWRGKYGIQWGTESDVDSSVQGLLRRAMLRRLKAEVLPQLPRKVVDVVDVELDDVGKKAERELGAALAYLADRGLRPDESVDLAKASTKIDFKKLSRAREILAVSKLPFAIEMAEELESAGRPVLVLSAHVAVAQAFSGRDGWAVITGDTADVDRTAIAERFQAGELRGIAGTIQAMGVAITLTRSSDAIVVDPVWVPDLNRQAEDRLHRIGQDQTVSIRYLRADHPVDRLVFEICGVKAGLVRSIVDGAAVTSAPEASTKVSDLLVAAPLGDGADALASAEEVAREIRALRETRETKDGLRRTRETCADRASRAATSRGFGIGSLAFASERRQANGVHETWAAVAIRSLAEVCDGALQEDGHGFMKGDVGLGHALAHQLAHDDGLTDGEWQVAIRIAMRYPGQVGRPEVTIDELIARSSIGEALDDIKARGIDAHLADKDR